MSNYTTFQIIKIIDEYSLVINGGLNHNVSLDDDIEIFVIGDEIIDPFNNNKSLGTLDFIKDTLKVTEIYRDFAVCTKIEELEEYKPSSIERMMNPLGVGETILSRSKKKMLINNEDKKTGRKTADKAISIGDTARIALSS